MTVVFASSARAWAMLVWTEGKLVARDTAGLIIPLGLPMLIMVMNGLGADGRGVPELGGLPVLDAYIVPLSIVMMLAVIGVVNMPSFLAAYRKSGVLRRLGVTPAHPVQVLVAQVVVSSVQAVGGLILALGLAKLVFDVSMPRNIPGAIGVFVLTAATMYSVGMLLAAVAPTPNSAVAIGLVLFFGLMALGGGFGGRELLPDVLATVGAYLPYGAGLDALSATWTGAAPVLPHLLPLAVATVVTSILAARLFRWS